MDEEQEERALELGVILLEVLRLLNKSEEEASTVEGLEHHELFTLLRGGPHATVTIEELDAAIATLLGNRMVSVLEDSQYAWDRGRIVGRRYTLALPGKEYLLLKNERSGRIA
ncbi:MAG: hypothetical protein L3J92_06350 [Thermoplasmata archaeon]|jgi:hypothetical protein|nr:hypothetical protein [Thermoplasmata archaeon]